MGSGASNLFSQNPMKNNPTTEEVPNFKIVLVGDANVGKSSIYLRYTREQFDYSYQPTINVNIGSVTKKLQQPFETLVSVTLWDIPGREEIDLRKSYYKDVDAAIVVVDLCDEGSIDMAGTWKQDITNNSLYTEEGDKWHRKNMRAQMQLPILLVGTKMDKMSIDEDASEQPKAVQRLEEIAVQHNFVGCVVVSACNIDGGVHAAFRSLVNYLLEKKMPKKVTRKRTEMTNLRDVFSNPNLHGKFARDLLSIEDHNYQPLQMCKIEEFDDLFKRCDKLVKAIEICCVGFLIAVKNFKRSCCVCGVTDSYKASIEECITNLKEILRENSEEDVLIAHEEAGYIRLEITGGPKEGIPGPLKRVLDIYENELCKTTRRVLSQCPTNRVALSDSLTTILALLPTANEKAAANKDLNKKQVKLSIQFINNNIARIEDTVFLADESMKVTDDQFQKIKTAMMW